MDGIASACVLALAIQMRGGLVDVQLPLRADGYGIRARHIETAAAFGYSLIITVDNGIVAFEAANCATELAVDLIITDHHELSADGRLPQALSIVNPRQPGCSYPARKLAGVGIAYLLARALGAPDEQLLPLVALGTVVDQADMSDLYNRRLVIDGLAALNAHPSPGLTALRKQFGLKVVDSKAVAFQYGPCLNAAGRMADPHLAYNLLATQDPQTAARHAKSLYQLNLERREQQALSSTRVGAHAEVLSALVVGYERDLSPGLIGLLAISLSQQYDRPAIVFCAEGDHARGSARAGAGYDLHAALSDVRVQQMVLQAGGHAGAAGVEVDVARIPELGVLLNQLLEAQRWPTLEPFYLDAMLHPAQADAELFDAIAQLDPFGQQFERPCFGLHAAVIERVQPISGGKHLIVFAEDTQFMLWNATLNAEDVPFVADLVYSIEIDGRGKPQYILSALAEEGLFA